MLKTRYLENSIAKDLKEKMVFVGGPRQVGKTTLAKMIANKYYKNPLYLNWDARDDQKQILAMRFPAETDFIIFDEIHKYRQWKNYLKGLFDKHKSKFNMLIIGSARLDLYRRGGDSLLGCYHYYRLHPFSLSELDRPKVNDIKVLNELRFSQARSSIFNDLFEFGGFPEPIVKHNSSTLRRWQNERLERLVREDIRDVELVRDISSLEILTDILPSKVGSLFSLNALREDFNVAHKTISHWVDILERFYYHFRIYPFRASTIKSLRQEPKLYLWDWSLILDDGIRLENIVASHLLKFTHFLYDSQGYKAELHFLRDREGRETDFLITVDKKPWMAIEVKNKEQNISKNLLYFTEKLKVPYIYQVVNTAGVDLVQDDVRIISADKFLTSLV